jgi:hypothetical protein
MRRRLSLALFALVLAVVAVPALAFEPGTASAQTDAERTRARAAYTEGQRRFDAGDFAGALTKFEEAYTIVNNPVVLLGVASAQERLGRIPEARATLERYLRERPTAPDRADIEARIAAMPAPAAPVEATAPATLVITSDPPGAAVVVDGESSGAVTPTEVTAAPGEHEVALALSGYELATRTVTGVLGERTEVAVTLTAMPEAEPMGEDEAVPEGEEETATEEEPAPAAGPSAATWVTTAIAGVALVTGTVFGFLALSRQSDFDVTPTVALADEGQAFALGADLAFGVAVAAGITAIVLYATDRPAAPAEAEADEGADEDAEGAEETAPAEETAALDPSVMFAPLVSPTGAGIAVGGSF